MLCWWSKDKKKKWQFHLWGSFIRHSTFEAKSLAPWGPWVTEILLNVWAWLNDGLVKVKAVVVIWVVVAIQPRWELWKSSYSKSQSAARWDQLTVTFLPLENTPKDLSGYITNTWSVVNVTAIWSASGKSTDQQFQMSLFGVKTRTVDWGAVHSQRCLHVDTETNWNQAADQACAAHFATTAYRIISARGMATHCPHRLSTNKVLCFRCKATIVRQTCDSCKRVAHISCDERGHTEASSSPSPVKLTTSNQIKFNNNPKLKRPVPLWVICLYIERVAMDCFHWGWGLPVGSLCAPCNYWQYTKDQVVSKHSSFGYRLTSDYILIVWSKTRWYPWNLLQWLRDLGTEGVCLRSVLLLAVLLISV